jgi:hypothetical protein
MRYLEKQIAQIEDRHWIIVTRDLWGSWTFSLWGPCPLNGGFGTIGEEDAKGQAFSAAKQHLIRNGWKVEAADVSELHWRVAVRQMVA